MLTGKPAGKRVVGRRRRGCEDSVRMDDKEIGASTRNWITFLQDRNYCIIYGVT